ncbi:hypothetical protein BGP77_10670 [Saccharospirillum sp. MSK14-1]|uniref:prepilin-type N-terminal cleavage/methylation domain-containing protein n=1 Tax=Saccharospirillum sp. MSK14-1 TaxID=1897632 RepID=UPI000D3BCC09|nr:prepilin-type N-terminal cleavage/methylation domain-containing protein [Saccharospirillum sp. MSK14-1]PTY38638.1 hypothetical protein BGP77_10670 [Saccharospirillum sp. MSK14-1]
MKKQQGFTLIELIMVIVVLGILSAFALPRFVDFSGNASTAAVEGAEGSIRSSAAIAHASCLANGNCGATGANANVTMDGVAVTMTNGYPSADATGIAEAANLGNFTLHTSTDVLSAAGTTAGIFFTRNATFAANDPCVSYIAAAAGGAPTITFSSVGNTANAGAETCG